jgi:hypothetical protein
VINALRDTVLSISSTNLAAKYIEIRRQQPTSFKIILAAPDSDAGKWIAGAIVANNSYPTQYSLMPFLDGITSSSVFNSYGTNSTLVLIPFVTEKSFRSGGFPLTADVKFSGPSPIITNKILPTIPSPANFKTIRQVKIPIILTEPAEVNIKIFSASGRAVKTLPKKSYSSPGLYEDIMWDGRDDNNEPVPSGVYIAVMQGNNFTYKEKIAVIR